VRRTLQEEFEGAAQARAALETITDQYEREAAERKVKLRTMGNIRLIGELYKTKMIVERILHRCVLPSSRGTRLRAFVHTPLVTKPKRHSQHGGNCPQLHWRAARQAEDGPARGERRGASASATRARVAHRCVCMPVPCVRRKLLTPFCLSCSFSLLHQALVNLLVTGACVLVCCYFTASLRVPPSALTAMLFPRRAVGKELDASPRSNTFMEAYFARLLQLSTSKKLASRLRFLCRDIIDLRKNKWVPRREKLQAKKLDQVRADAAVALGIVKPQDENLFPEGPNGPTEDGWSVAGKKNKPKVEEGYSALTGQYVPSTNTRMPTDRPRREAKQPAASKAEAEVAPEAAQEAPAPPVVEAKPAAPVEKKKPVAKLKEEELPEQCAKLFEEYKSAADLKEALLCVEDIKKRAPDAAAAMELLCVLTVQNVVDDSTERGAEQMTKLLAYLAEHKAISAEPLTVGLGKQLAQLDDLAIDVPMAPKLLGMVLGGLIAAKALESAYLRTGCEKVEDMLYRRDLAVAALAHIKEAGSPPLLKLSVDVPLKDFLTSACALVLSRICRCVQLYWLLLTHTLLTPARAGEDDDAASLIALLEKKGLPPSLVPA
jgi:hypothetical protein